MWKEQWTMVKLLITQTWYLINCVTISQSTHSVMDICFHTMDFAVAVQPKMCNGSISEVKGTVTGRFTVCVCALKIVTVWKEENHCPPGCHVYQQLHREG